MPLTPSQMVNEVCDNLSRSTTGTTVSGSTLSTMALRWLNRAQVRVYRRYDVLYKISTASSVASQQSYSFPSNMSMLYSLRLENGLQSVRLECVMPWEMDKYVPRPASLSTRQPTIYVPYKLSNTYELYPIPDAAYTMRMRHSIVPTDMTIGGTQSDYSDVLDLDDVLIYYATAEGYFWLQELVDGAAWEKKGDQALTEAMDRVEDWPDWAPRSRGFSASGSSYLLGEYYNDPFVRSLAEL